MTIIFGSFFTLNLILSLIFGLSINIDNELSNLLNFAQLNPYSEAYINEIISINNLSSIFDFSSFIFWSFGIKTIYSIFSFGVGSFVILWNFLVPVSLVLIAALAIIYFSLFFIEKINKEYKYKMFKNIGKWGMYISFIAFSVFFIIIIIKVAVLESQFNNIEQLQQILNGFNTNDRLIEKINLINFLLENRTTTMLSHGIRDVDFISGLSYINNNLLISFFVFVLILLPISLITTILLGAIWISTFICYGRSKEFSKFKRWMGNKRIDSVRELRQSIFKNWYFLILFVMFISIMIYPVSLHDYQSYSLIIISILILLLVLPASFIPLVIMWVQISKIKIFNFNKMMFIQMIVLGCVSNIIVLFFLVLFKNYIIGPYSIVLLQIYITLTVSLISIFGFIKWRS